MENLKLDKITGLRPDKTQRALPVKLKEDNKLPQEDRKMKESPRTKQGKKY